MLTIGRCGIAKQAFQKLAMGVGFFLVVASGPLIGSSLAQEGGAELKNDTAIDFHIPPQPLGSALNAFAVASGWQISASSELTKGTDSAGVVGNYSREQGLHNLLSGTGLTYRMDGQQMVTIERDASSGVVPGMMGAAGAGAAAGAVAAENADGAVMQNPQKPVKVPEIMVKDVKQRDDDTKSYVVEEANAATRTDTPVRDVPQSIQVITRKVLEEQRVFRVPDVLQNIAGVNPNSNPSGIFDSVLVRGFLLSNRNFYRNGLFDGTAGQLGSDTYNMQRIEMLKGPSAVLYGQGDPGGILNIVTRKPMPNPSYAGNVTLGNFNFYRSEIDATGPLNASKTLMYRLDVVGQKANTFIDYVSQDLVGIAPTVTWLMGSRTTLTVEADYLKRWSNNVNGVPAQGSVLPNINGELPRNLYVGLGDFDKNNRTSYRISYDLTHQFNNTWSIRNAYRYSQLEYDQLTASPGTLSVINQRILTRSGSNNASGLAREHHHDMITNLVGHFRIFEMDHTLLTGVEFRQDMVDPWVRTSNSVAPIDLFAPNYSFGLGTVTGTSSFKGDTKNAGLYLQDQIALLPNLKFMGGFRFDYIHQMQNLNWQAGSPQQTSDDTGISPRLGLVYQPIEPVSLYTSWMRGFSANAPGSFNPTGELFKPERSTQYEIGVKTFFLENRVSTTLAWYHLTRENLVTPDPDPARALQGFSVQTGEQRSQGIELDVTASLIAGWNIIASYAYTDAEVTQDNNPALLHKRLANVPYNKATIWSTYHFQEGALKGFGLGGGVYGYTRRNSSIFGPQVNDPGYVRVDTALYYDHDLPQGNWLGAKVLNMAVNLRNLLDQRYIVQSSNSTTAFQFAEPRTILATVGLQF